MKNCSIISTNTENKIQYIAPELFIGRDYTYSSDVYSFGIVLYELFIEELAYKNDERFSKPWDVFDFVSKGKRLEKPDRIPDEYWKLIQQCWNHSFELRPSFEYISFILINWKNEYSNNLAHSNSDINYSTDNYIINDDFDEDSSISSSNESD